jgi:hypothetical protein
MCAQQVLLLLVVAHKGWLLRAAFQRHAGVARPDTTMGCCVRCLPFKRWAATEAASAAGTRNSDSAGAGGIPDLQCCGVGPRLARVAGLQMQLSVSCCVDAEGVPDHHCCAVQTAPSIIMVTLSVIGEHLAAAFRTSLGDPHSENNNSQTRARQRLATCQKLSEHQPHTPKPTQTRHSPPFALPPSRVPQVSLACSP